MVEPTHELHVRVSIFYFTEIHHGISVIYTDETVPPARSSTNSEMTHLNVTEENSKGCIVANP